MHLFSCNIYGVIENKFVPLQPITHYHLSDE